MLDQYNRSINYLRISITDRCNQRCIYCMPEGHINYIPEDELISCDDIIKVVKEAVTLGINKVRITGGEPLVRKDVVSLVNRISKIEGINDLSMTTNGFLLNEYAKPLFEAGLKRLNISLDTMDKDRYALITTGSDLDRVLQGIQKAKEAGFSPIKLNCVIKQNSREEDAVRVAEYAKQQNFEIRYIREMNLEKGEFWQVQGGIGGACSICNRIRLTSDGCIKPCLFNDISYSIYKYGVREALLKAISSKPERGLKSNRNTFYNTGG